MDLNRPTQILGQFFQLHASNDGRARNTPSTILDLLLATFIACRVNASLVAKRTQFDALIIFNNRSIYRRYRPAA
jgi:hypothetical protein